MESEANLPAGTAWTIQTAAFRGTLSAGWSRSFFLARVKWVKIRTRKMPEGPKWDGSAFRRGHGTCPSLGTPCH